MPQGCSKHACHGEWFLHPKREHLYFGGAKSRFVRETLEPGFRHYVDQRSGVDAGSHRRLIYADMALGDRPRFPTDLVHGMDEIDTLFLLVVVHIIFLGVFH